MAPRGNDKDYEQSRLKDYIEVKHRIVQFRKDYPDGRFRPADPAVPFTLVEAGGQTFVAVTMACYRGPDDTNPGVASAWQVVPGVTPYTRNSELMNAETSAIGRAIIAALAGDASKSLASADEVRQAQDNNLTIDEATIAELEAWRATLKTLAEGKDHDQRMKAKSIIGRWKGITRNQTDLAQLEASRGERLIRMLEQEWGGPLEPARVESAADAVRLADDLAAHSEPDMRPEQVDRAVIYPPGHEPFAPEPVGE